MEEITVALGGGGVKGIAHIGVLQELERNGFKIGAVSGTSAGGLVGAVYASGKSPADLIDIVTHMDQKTLFARGVNEGPSVLGLKGLTDLLTRVVGDLTFDQLKILFACTGVDITTSREFILNEGRLIDAVLATVAIPGVFPPRMIGSTQLVDGGVLDPVPVAVARWLNPVLPVVAVCLQPEPEAWADTPPTFRVPSSSPIPAPIVDYLSRLRLGQAMQIFLQAYETSTLMLTELRLQVDKPEVIIRPNVGKYGILDDVNPLDLIALGEMAVREVLPQIRESLTWSNSIRRRFRKAEAPGNVTGFAKEPNSEDK